MISLCARLQIERLGQRGEGIARGPDGLVFIPYALPGETIVAEVDGARGRLVEIATASPERIPAFCRYFSDCGGCAVQTLASHAYAQWKRSLLLGALTQAGVKGQVEALADAHGEGRRRATFHARYDSHGRAAAGFMQSRAHRIVEIETCPILAPSMSGAPRVARAIAEALAESAKPLDILCTATSSGLDVDVRGHGPLGESATKRLVETALAQDLARLSNHGEIVVLQRAPLLAMGRAMVAPPSGAFLQATEAGEKLLAARVCEAVAGSGRIADLFAGVGTFSLRMAEFAQIHAIDLEEPALSALAKAAAVQGLLPVEIEARDLFRRPFSAQEAAHYDAVVFDPPRAGAEQQARALASSRTPLVVAVSCNVQTFARDAAILCAGGYEIARIEPIDQFRHSPHVEIVGIFRRPTQKSRRARRLLG
ncbi:class I SAM-dependent RNA methyltransferase [Methylocapsa acidiphila]|uniref:class I SAM-dependent RNA methyltransferase n=1 Tax=Methylocapsa acidiphila TaxID=133552 RepID=UPI000408E6E9|nr:methyltransferase [Methylocapsa acidiphila]